MTEQQQGETEAAKVLATLSYQMDEAGTMQQFFDRTSSIHGGPTDSSRVEWGELLLAALPEPVRQRVSAALVGERWDGVQTTETAWLIERGQPEQQEPTVWLEPMRRWGVVTSNDRWTTDAFEARRFDTREAAGAEIESRQPFVGRAVSHGFIQPANQPQGDLDADAAWAALREIAFLGTDVPAAHNNAESFYRNGLMHAIGTAARALQAAQLGQQAGRTETK